MEIKHRDIVIDKDNPFINCKLNRKPYADVLTEIISTYANGFVLSINNEWGTGKTTFVKMWEQHLINEEFQTVYFNAWENDFDSNPLVAIMAELKTLINSDNKESFKSVIKKGAILTKSIAPAILKAIAEKYIDTKAITEAIENTAKGATEILEEEIKEYTNKKKTIKEFRSELANFINKTDSIKPLVFIIDELDRCRPNYAVEVLEQMKHFFSVEGIVFVLSIDKNHLASSIRGVYGSEHINTDEYLRRFIDLEYSIPQPSTKDFIDYLFEYYSFKDFFSSEERKKYREFSDETRQFLLMANYLLNKTNTTLRQQEKIFAHTRLVLCSFNYNHYVFSALLFMLVYLKSIKYDIFQKIEKNQFSLQELSDIFTSLFIRTKEEDINFSYIEALLLTFYNNNQEYSYKENLVDVDGNQSTTFIKSKLESKNYNLADYLLTVQRQQYGRVSLSLLLEKINLTQPLVNNN